MAARSPAKNMSDSSCSTREMWPRSGNPAGERVDGRLLPGPGNPDTTSSSQRPSPKPPPPQEGAPKSVSNPRSTSRTCTFPGPECLSLQLQLPGNSGVSSQPSSFSGLRSPETQPLSAFPGLRGSDSQPPLPWDSRG